MSYVPARRARLGDASSSAAGAAVGTAVAGPVGTAVGGLVGGLFHSGSPRYEGGPLLSTVQNRLSALKAGDPTNINQTHQDAVSGGPGWKDVALVLAPVVRPDLFPAPIRSLTTQEQALVAPYVGSSVAGAAKVATTPKPGGTAPVTAAGFSGVVGWVLGLGVVGAILVGSGRGGRRRRR